MSRFFNLCSACWRW